MLDNLTAGPETDALVAKALGWMHVNAKDENGPCIVAHNARQSRNVHFSPSTCWNAAMEAAEGAGVWQGCFFGNYGIWRWQNCGHVSCATVDLWVDDETPLGICKAILKLREVSDA